MAADFQIKLIRQAKNALATLSVMYSEWMRGNEVVLNLSVYLFQSIKE